MQMIRNFETGILGALMGAAASTGGGQAGTHIVRTTNRGTIDRLIVALRRSEDRIDALESENRDLRARLAAANRATLATLQSQGV
tara:strand:+ start:183 stop:437 length:255 start_codon:yes stop_codon:yes gene_type:complete